MILKKIILLINFFITCLVVNAQKVDSIFFHLYTDSLKKGTHNYINVDGKLSNGRWLPLTSKEIQFSSSAGTFEGNDLVLSADLIEEKVTVKAVLRAKPVLWKEVTIWIKKNPDPEILPAKEEIMKNVPSKSKNKRNGK
jgi:septum formation inhibitor MinC